MARLGLVVRTMMIGSHGLAWVLLSVFLCGGAQRGTFLARESVFA